MKYISIIGSTGSIGTQTLDIVRSNKDLKVTALAAGTSIDLLEKQAREFQPVIVAVYNEQKGSRQTSFVFPVCHGWISQATAHGCQPEDQIYFRSLHLENMWKKRAEESCLLL